MADTTQTEPQPVAQPEEGAHPALAAPALWINAVNLFVSDHAVRLMFGEHMGGAIFPRSAVAMPVETALALAQSILDTVKKHVENRQAAEAEHGSDD